MTIRSFIGIAAASVLALLLGVLWIQSARLDAAYETLTTTRQELDTERRTSAGLRVAIDELERNAADKSRTETVATTAKEGIAAAPEGDNGGVANVLLQGLRAADEIGGLE